jgi:hypothetical protein
MTAPHADQLIDGYLARIQAAAADLSAGARNELVGDMRSHIAEARARDSEETDASILNLLDRLGEPDVVVEEARNRTHGRAGASPPVAPYRPGILEIAALVLLPLIWPIGVTLLWISPVWKTRDKIIGTLVPPGGYLGLFMLALSHVVVVQGSDGFSAWQVLEIILLRAMYLTLPVFTVGYLAIRLRWGRRPSQPVLA